jgi:hypothetical protein
MRLIFRKFLSLFGNFFKLIEENTQINIIKSLDKDNRGLTVAKISTLSSQSISELYPHYILSNNIIRSQFSDYDIQLLKAIAMAEGDFFIIAKEYVADKEIYILKSCLDKEIYKFEHHDLIENKKIFKRINKRFLTNNIDTLSIKAHLESNHEIPVSSN